jgi:hypothetical protein
MTGGSTGIVFAIYTIGFIAASPFTGPVGDRKYTFRSIELLKFSGCLRQKPGMPSMDDSSPESRH